MDQSPTDSYVDSGIWNRDPKPFQDSTSTTSKSRGGASTSGRQITRNRASYSCHSCRRRKVKCDKVREAFWVGVIRVSHTDLFRSIQYAGIVRRTETNAYTMPRHRETPDRARDKQKVVDKESNGGGRHRGHLRRTLMKYNPFTAIYGRLGRLNKSLVRKRLRRDSPTLRR